ncbi:hypothetical protein IAG44_24550 [Streptomyces roseirectus]|uniref:AG1 protein n=1 Tax=Streptomyces roseirectus TaxID=2768066 RepID=A0A7H0IHK7_9ACTN|nr:hypothetical protein [Streptomyces roseirectus]QNP72273.1 hypothetical protein IAG44_24550 [Streptomyces roseirectus]
MAWDEWEQLKAGALERQQGSSGMQLNSVDLGTDSNGRQATMPSAYGVLKVSQKDLAAIGKSAHTLFNDLYDKARVAGPSSDSAAKDLTGQGFALGAALQHVSTRWTAQLKSLLDACAHISNHMHVTKRLHAGDDDYIARVVSSIAVLDDGFDERVGKPGTPNSVYGEPKKKE